MDWWDGIDAMERKHQRDIAGDQTFKRAMLAAICGGSEQVWIAPAVMVEIVPPLDKLGKRKPEPKPAPEIDPAELIAKRHGITRAQLSAAISFVAGSATNTMDEIKYEVCAQFGISRIDLESHRRNHRITKPRQLAMALARRLTPLSFPEIARRVGKADHSTAVHATHQFDPVVDAAAARVPVGASIADWVAAARQIMLEAAP